MSVRGVEFHTEESPQAIIKAADGTLTLKTNKETIDGFSHIMFATGRKPNTKVNFLFLLQTAVFTKNIILVNMKMELADSQAFTKNVLATWLCKVLCILHHSWCDL